MRYGRAEIRFTGGVRWRRGSSEPVTWNELEIRCEALSLIAVVGHELDIESVSGGRHCFIVGIATELT